MKNNPEIGLFKGLKCLDYKTVSVNGCTVGRITKRGKGRYQVSYYDDANKTHVPLEVFDVLSASEKYAREVFKNRDLVEKYIGGFMRVNSLVNVTSKIYTKEAKNEQH